MSNSYVVYFLDGPKKGETLTVLQRVYSLRLCVPSKPERVLSRSEDWAEEAKTEYITYHIHEIDGKLFGLCDENGLGFANLVAKALIEHTSGLLDEAIQHLQTINNELDREYGIDSDGAIHGDVSEFLVKVRQYNE